MSSSNDTAASCAAAAAAVEFNGDVLVLGGGADEGVDGSEEGVHRREERIHFDLSCVAGELCRSGCWVTLPRCPSTYIHLDYEFSGIFGVQYERPATKEWGRQIQEWLGLVARSIRALEDAVGPSEVQGLMQMIDSETLPTAAVHVAIHQSVICPYPGRQLTVATQCVKNFRLKPTRLYFIHCEKYVPSVKSNGFGRFSTERG